MSIISDTADAQRLHNLLESKLAEAITRDNYQIPPKTKISIWRRLFWKLKWPFGLRIIHKYNIPEEDYY